MTIFAQKYILIEQFESNGILAQLGEHLPYKQGVTGSSPVGPTRLSKDNQGSRCGGTGRRAGLKILLWQHSTGSIPVTGMFKFFKALGVPDFFRYVFFYVIRKSSIISYYIKSSVRNVVEIPYLLYKYKSLT